MTQECIFISYNLQEAEMADIGLHVNTVESSACIAM